ncbi:MAG: zinc ribbon domain-containing protein [Thermoplasmata archaeon]|nr:zinc ribbon domain-containing protein [Thermoplasmata archaeon]
MNCPFCSTTLPDGAKFCYSCGKAIPSAAAPPPAAAAPSGPVELKCKACGAPLHPVFGEMVVSCDYCGASISLAGGNWKEISKHSMLPPKVTEAGQALEVIRGFLDQGLFHKHAFEEAKVEEQRLTFVPFWVVPVSASTTFQYQDIAVGVGGTVASVAMGAVLGSALSGGLGGGRRGGGVAVVPIMGGGMNATRAGTISQQYEYPVVAVKGMTMYQPHNYTFGLADRSFYDKKSVPEGSQVLNGDLGEDAAAHAAEAFVNQLQFEAAHKQHHMVSSLQTQVQVSEAELLHVPVWYIRLDRKGQKIEILVDAHAGKVMQTVGNTPA